MSSHPFLCDLIVFGDASACPQSQDSESQFFVSYLQPSAASVKRSLDAYDCSVVVVNTAQLQREAASVVSLGVVLGAQCGADVTTVNVNSRAPRWAVKLHTADDERRFWQSLLRNRSVSEAAQLANADWRGAGYDRLTSTALCVPAFSPRHVAYNNDMQLLVRTEGPHLFLQHPSTHDCLCRANNDDAQPRWSSADGWPMSPDALVMAKTDGRLWTWNFEDAFPATTPITLSEARRDVLTLQDSLALGSGVVRGYFGERDWSVVTEIDFRSMGLTAIPSPLQMARALQRADLSDNEIEVLPSWISNWEDLRQLSLAFNRISVWPDAACFSKLTDLLLSNNRFETLPSSVGSFLSMRRLDLELCNLKSLPSELGGLLDLRELFIDGNKDLQPIELQSLLSAGAISYLRALFSEPLQVQFLRIMVVGAANQGKTCLIDRLRASAIVGDESVRVETFGIDIKPWRPSSFMFGGKPVDIDFWDCAGQPHFYPTHQLFMVPDALFWVVFSLGEAEKDLRAAVFQVVDFVRFVRSCVRDAWILIVGTKRDLAIRKGLVTELNVELHKELQEDKFIVRPREAWYVMAVHCRDSKKFGEDGIASLQKAVEKSFESLTVGKTFPKVYFEVESRVLAHSKTVDLEGSDPNDPFADPAADETSPVLSVATFSSRFGLGNDLEMVRYLEARGCILHVGDTVVLAPQWLINTVVNHLFRADLGHRDGILQEETLLGLWTNVSQARKRVALDLLRKYQVAFPVGGNQWFIPILAKDAADGEGPQCRAREFHIQLSAPVYGLYSLMLCYWQRIYPDTTAVLLRRNKFAFLFANAEGGYDQCVVDLKTTGFTIRVSQGAEWLAYHVIDRVECLVRANFPSVKVWATDSTGSVRFEVDRLRREKKVLLSGQAWICEQLLPDCGYSKVDQDVRYDVALVYVRDDFLFVLQCARELQKIGLRCTLFDWPASVSNGRANWLQPQRCRLGIVFVSAALLALEDLRMFRLEYSHESLVCEALTAALLDGASVPQYPMHTARRDLQACNVLSRLTTAPDRRDAVCLASNIMRVLKRQK